MKDMKGYVPDHWTLDEALTLIRTLQPETRRFNYHLCLGGGVLNKGTSNKDLDLFFLPMSNGKEADLSGLHEWLCGLWGDGQKLGGDDEGRYEGDEESDYTLKVKFMYSGLRVDVFVVGGVEKEKPKDNKDTTSKLSPSLAEMARRYGIDTQRIQQFTQAPAQTGTWQGIIRTDEPIWQTVPTTQQARQAINWREISESLRNQRERDREGDG